MKQTLFKNLSIYCTRNFLSPQTFKPHLNGNNIRPLTSLSPSPPFRLRLLSSKADSFAANSDSVAETNSAQTQKEESSTDVDDVSNEELKRRIERYFGGDEEAIPSIFEAILKRKLAGKHDDSDDELMEEFGRKLANDVSDEEFDSEED
ncbi:uncharacterized protein LOC131310607 [Rhododendron vialii]|uniref:uncharacterized protein LOC131310607 n=1 Tax=Rhododendron vialii TaxID=182163 RepID=UPI00265D67C6|nr:uncharacterized protein LOC131310607 [Rhododendron vialii]XP_058193704.1 uncharacterized protein LOC131310607 [Rhododendron vialii]XP_058193705.1 uncharacterized protein LOC131310607 [Rhododendron vialii]XP_058193706.1 uncharacterized protein LOC131310607 [Rhododendron vialii]XP_058193707.1 uncharacterized protein LOC131310607 [Rhododendron vialii]XP_058193708.1 uncharacterized protein LOC131310607 [Rhododendron vialii]XP_058193710.1 uncharacterized protein LOC131310607 [Rhododendron viali